MDALEIIRSIGDPDPVLSHKFGVFFLMRGVFPNPIDFRFQRVSGISTEVQLETVNQGGQNLHTYALPGRITHNNLVLERGHSIGIPSPLVADFHTAFSTFRFHHSDVLVMLFDEVLGVPAPVSAWLFKRAYPVKWSVSDLDAQSNTVLVDTMELAYTRFQTLAI